MKGISSSINYGRESIFFDVLFVNRKTMEIAVHPDSRLVVKAPIGTDLMDIKSRLIKRARWITKQLAYFGQFDPRTPPRRYVGGESHLYLGRQYRLKIQVGEINQVKLVRGYFHVTINSDPNPELMKRLLGRWYAEKARERYKEIYERYLPEFKRQGLAVPRVMIQRMKTRWGSLSSNGTLTLNVELIRAPKECIEYVITHELCHLKYRQHDAAFYRLLEQHMPDWQKRKHKLELALV